VENIARSILRNERRVIPLSTNGKGFHGLDEDCFLSLPLVVGAGGLQHTMRLPLSDTEDEALQRSIEILLELRRTVDLILATP
jgi:L-lactate dehydrogenase